MGKVEKSQQRLAITDINDKKGGIKTYGKGMGRFLWLFGAAKKIDGEDRYVGIYSLRRFIKDHKSELTDIKAPRIYSSTEAVNACLKSINEKMKKIPIPSVHSRPSSSAISLPTDEPKVVPQPEEVKPEPELKPEPEVKPEPKLEPKPVVASPYDSVNIPEKVSQQYALIAEQLKRENRRIALPHAGMFMSAPETAMNLFVKRIDSLPEDDQSTYYGMTYQLMKSVQEHVETSQLKKQAEEGVLYLAETYLDIEKSKEAFNPLAFECASLIYYSANSDESFKGDAAYYLGREQETKNRLNSAQTFFEESYTSYGIAAKKAVAEDKNQLLRCQIDAGYKLSKLKQRNDLEGAHKICDEIKKLAERLKLKLDYVNDLWLEQYKKVQDANKKPQAPAPAPAPVKAPESSKPVEAVSKNLNEIELRNQYALLSQFVQRIDQNLKVKTPFPSLEAIQKSPWEFGKTFYDFMSELHEDEFLKDSDFKKVIDEIHKFLKVMENNLNNVELNLQVSMGIAYLNVETIQVMTNRANVVVRDSNDFGLKLEARIYVLAEKAKTERDKISILSTVLAETRGTPQMSKQRLAAAEKLFLLKSSSWTPTEECATVVYQLSENRIHKATAAAFLGESFQKKNIVSTTLEKQDLEKGGNLLEAAKYCFAAYMFYKQEADALEGETDLSADEKKAIASFRNHQSKNVQSALKCCKESIEDLEGVRDSLTSNILPEAKTLLDKLNHL